MLLIFITALISFHAKRFYTVPVFAIASHVMLGILYSFNSIGGNDQYIGVVVSALISLVIGSVLYGWTFWYKRKHDIDDIKRIRRRVTKILGTLILIVGLLNIWIIYQGIESGKRLVENARLRKTEIKAEDVENKEIQYTKYPLPVEIAAPKSDETPLDKQRTRYFLPVELINPDGSPTPLARDMQQRKADAAWETARDKAVLQAVGHL